MAVASNTKTYYQVANNDAEDEKNRLLSIWELVMKDMHGKLVNDDGDTLHFLQNIFPKDVYPSRNEVTSTCDCCMRTFDPRFETPCTMPHEFVAGPRRKQAWPAIYMWTCRRCKKTFETDNVETRPTESCSCSKHSGSIEPAPNHGNDTSTTTLPENTNTEKNANDSHPGTNENIKERERVTCIGRITKEEATTISVSTDESPHNDKKTKKKKKKKTKGKGAKKKMPHKHWSFASQRKRKKRRQKAAAEQNTKSIKSTVFADGVSSSQEAFAYTVQV